MVKRVDILIVGCGPAGLQAAITAAVHRMSVLVVGKPGGSALAKAHIDNYFGVKGPVDGLRLLEVGLAQARSKGVEILGEDVVELGREDGLFKAKTEGGLTVLADAMVLAMGARRRRLGVKGERRLLGRGVSYCAECDGGFFRGLTVAVVGGESAAAYAALLLSGYASKVWLIAEKVGFSSRLLEELRESRVEILEGRRVLEILGEDKVEGVLLDDDRRLDVQGVFIELGSRGVLELAMGVGLIPDEKGYVKVDRKQATDVEGVYACGDLCGPPLSLAKAVGEGYVAGASASSYVRAKKGSGG